MRSELKNILLKLIPERIQDFFYYTHKNYKKSIGGEVSYSQEGEDMILRRIFKEPTGFYIDIGAHHPINQSNTNYFYQKGWSGINIDATPKSMEEFNKIRIRDINIEAIVSETDGDMDFYLFEPSLMNTISKEQYESNKKFNWCKFIGIKRIKSIPLHRIYNDYGGERKVDFINIDVEGAEIAVLKSNDWKSLKPNVLLIEIIDKTIKQIYSTEVYNFLESLGYDFFAKSGNTCFFKLKGFFEF